MNKTVSVNISGRCFHVDDTAYESLNKYLSNLKLYFKKEVGGEEVIRDIEKKISALFSERVTDFKEVINTSDVDFIISQLGTPEDLGVDYSFREEAQKKTSISNKKKSKTIFRDSDARVIGGVCAGFGHYLEIDKLFIRIAFIVFTFAGIGFTIPVYFILWAIIPKVRSAADKLKMEGGDLKVDDI